LSLLTPMRIPRSTRADCVGSSSSSSCSSVLSLTSDSEAEPEYSFNSWRWEKIGSSRVSLFEGLLVCEKDAFITPFDRAIVPSRGVAPKSVLSEY
jgi:hypothetical protein